jgi:polysaccharide pyruvyl transferase WcaK-like protein
MNELVTLLEKSAVMYEKIILIPMHTFFIGGDDRKYLTETAIKVNKSNVFVQQKPLNVYETYSLFFNAKACIGIRYHSVVFQTLLNGNNYILDYTNKKTGKIVSFVEDIDNDFFYQNRYYNLSDSSKYLDNEHIIEILKKKEYFEYPKEIYENTIKSYVNILTKLN